MKVKLLDTVLLREETIKYDEIKTSQSAFDTISKLSNICNYTEEKTVLVVLNVKNKVLGMFEIAHGGINTCNVDFKSIFKRILLLNGSSFILAHNHITGDLQASIQDITFTIKLLEASKLLDIEFLDHLIVSGNEFLSMKSKNIF